MCQKDTQKNHTQKSILDDDTDTGRYRKRNPRKSLSDSLCTRARCHLNLESGGYQQRFSHIFIRSNLSLTLEDASNTRTLFAVNYDGKKLPSDLIFEAYRWSDPYGTSGKYEKLTKLPITYSATKRLYTLTDPSIAFDLLIAKNADSFGIVNLTQDQTSNYDFKYISGQDASNRDYLYIYPDRPLYQLGDTVFFKGILRNYHFDGYQTSSIRTGTVRIMGGQ